MQPNVERYASPVAERIPPPEPDSVRAFWIGLRLHLAAILTATVLGLATAAVLQWELFDPKATFSVDTYGRLFAVHATMWWVAALPLSTGVLSAAALPRALGIPAMRGWQLLYASLAVWPFGPLILLARTEPLGSVSPAALAFAVTTTGLAILAVQVLWTLFLHRDRFPKAPFLILGLGGAAVLQLLTFAGSTVQLGGAMAGMSSLGTDLIRKPFLAVPIAMGIAAHTLQRHAKRTPPAPSILALSMLAPSLVPWVHRTGVWTNLLAVVSTTSVVVFMILLSIHYVRSPSRLHRRPVLAMIIATLVTARALVDAFGLLLSVDVHLHETYFALVPIHLAWLVLVLALVLIASDEPGLLAGRSPIPSRLQIGGALCAIGLGGAFVMMLLLGQNGMPRGYQVYIPRFTSDFQWMAALTALGILGVLILAAGFLPSRRVSVFKAKVAATRRVSAPTPPDASSESSDDELPDKLT